MSSAADRIRRHRERERHGLIVLQLEVHEHRLAARLIDGGYLSDIDAMDREKLADAVIRLLDQWLGDVTRYGSSA